ncbi:MAG: glycosyltransferase family 4 protein [Blastocatellia bacterium]
MKNAALVVAGNRYIAARATQSRARKIAIVPTVVDLAAYPLSPPPENKIFTIGWIGTPFTAHHLRSIQPALQQFCCAGNAQVVAIGAESLQLDGVNLQVKSWQQQTEAHELRQFDVGIMPLQDAAFERGKCGLKLIQYMAAARPVIATPVGVNQEIVKDGQNGFLATTTEEWLAALSWIKQDRPLGQVLGAKGRAQVEREFCLQITAPKIAQLLYQAAQKVPPHSLASLVGPHESASRLAKPQRESMIPAASGSRPLPANSRKESSQ